MASIPVVVKHSGKKYDVDLDPSSNGETFKYQLYTLTGVEPERQKIIVKGGMLKDETELGTLNIKPGHQFMLMGTPAGGAPVIQKPKEQTKFLEDMTEAEAAQSEGATPAGLQNLGNTCYMNSTLQTLRAIPELQTELQNYKSGTTSSASSGNLGDLSQFGLGGLGSSTDLTASLRDLYKQMSETQEGFPPLMFLNAFRGAYPQFAEKTRDGRGYAQQDAEEAWSQLISSLRQKLKIKNATGEDPSTSPEKYFIDTYLGGRFEKYEQCVDPEAISAGEEAVRREDETFYKLNCYVASKDIIHLRDGVAAALNDSYTKTSATLNREATYTVKSRISRLPKYLPVHFVRFFWKRDVNKKAKILRKVTFPHELDVVEYCSDDLKAMLIPVRDKIRDLRKEEIDVERARKRQKRMRQAEAADAERQLKATGPASEKKLLKEKEVKAEASTSKAKSSSGGGDVEMKDGEEAVYKTDAQIEAEQAEKILAAKRDLLNVVSPTLSADKAANHTGLYELCGVITHQGASADSGHYTAYVKKDNRSKTKVGNPKREAVNGNEGAEDDGKWWWFNDEKVSEVEAEKIETLAGGGESHAALILLYRAVELPTLTEEEMKNSSSTA